MNKLSSRLTAMLLAAGMFFCMAPLSVHADTGSVKDVYIDNTVDASVSYVKAVVEIKYTSTGETVSAEVYNNQASVTYSNPQTSEVSGMISSAEAAARSYAAERGCTVTECGVSTLTGRVWDNRKYTTVEDSDAILIGDAGVLPSGGSGYTRTHIASGDYGKETTYTITVKAEKAEKGQDDPAPVTPAKPGGTAPKAWEGRQENPHTHTYVWQTQMQATETEDGEKIYVCSECGHVLYRAPISGYYQFCAGTADRIRKAAPGAVVDVRTDRWISFAGIVLQAMAERPDVTVKVSFLENEFRGRRLGVTIPAGTNALSLADENGYAGFMFLAGQFGFSEE